MRRRNVVILSSFAVIAAAGLAAGFGAVDLRKELFKQSFPTDYFDPEDAKPDLFERVSGNVYTFRRGLARGMIVDTGEGLAVFDTFNETYARRLKAILARTFPGKKVKWVFYSHNHLDHIRGAALFEPEQIVGHKDINRLLADWPQASDIARVTTPIDGDVELTLGSTVVRLLYMPHSHSTTLYGYYVPAAKAVFAPDMMFKKTLPPFGFPDWYYPGYVRALDRLIALDGEHYIPTHFDRGGRTDMVEYRNMMVEFNEAVTKAALVHGRETPDKGEIGRQILADAYDALKPKYGDWHGFKSMFIPHFGRSLGGAYLGY